MCEVVVVVMVVVVAGPLRICCVGSLVTWWCVVWRCNSGPHVVLYGKVVERGGGGGGGVVGSWCEWFMYAYVVRGWWRWCSAAGLAVGAGGLA